MLGHSWIEIFSHSAFEQTIGHYQLPPFGNVSIGRWGSQISESTDGDFEGIWYNREVYELAVNGKYSSYVCSYQTISKDKINALNSLIRSTYNGYALLTNNCVHFAVEAWNCCVESYNEVSTIVITPDALEDEIEDLQYSYSGNTNYFPVTIICGFYNGSQYVEHRITNYGE